MSNNTNRFSVLAAIAMLAFCFQSRAADDQVQVVSESNLKSFWLPSRHNPPPQYPIDAVKDGGEGCVAVAFEIHGDGSVSNERVWRSALNDANASGELKEAALFGVHKWHFEPAPANTNRDPVYTYAVVTFTLSNSDKWSKYDRERNAKNKAKCEMTDFPQQVQAMINSAQTGKKP